MSTPDLLIQNGHTMVLKPSEKLSEPLPLVHCLSTLLP